MEHWNIAKRKKKRKTYDTQEMRERICSKTLIVTKRSNNVTITSELKTLSANREMFCDKSQI